MKSNGVKCSVIGLSKRNIFEIKKFITTERDNVIVLNHFEQINLLKYFMQKEYDIYLFVGIYLWKV